MEGNDEKRVVGSRREGRGSAMIDEWPGGYLVWYRLMKGSTGSTFFALPSSSQKKPTGEVHTCNHLKVSSWPEMVVSG